MVIISLGMESKPYHFCFLKNRQNKNKKLLVGLPKIIDYKDDY